MRPLDSDTRRRSQSFVGEVLAIVVGAAALVGGVLVGRGIAYEASLGGFFRINSGILTFLVVVVVVGLLLVGLIARQVRHGQVGLPIVTTLAVSGLIAAGAFGGAATARWTGGVHVDPVTLSAVGATRLRLEAGSLAFVARPDSTADCVSAPDGRVVAHLAAMDLGELGAGTLQATLRLGSSSDDLMSAQFFIDGGDLPAGAAQPFWSGAVLIIDMSPDHASGRLAFDGLRREIDPAVPQSNVAGSSRWPDTLSGEMTWSCGAW